MLAWKRTLGRAAGAVARLLQLACCGVATAPAIGHPLIYLVNLSGEPSMQTPLKPGFLGLEPSRWVVSR